MSVYSNCDALEGIGRGVRLIQWHVSICHSRLTQEFIKITAWIWDEGPRKSQTKGATQPTRSGRCFEFNQERNLRFKEQAEQFASCIRSGAVESYSSIATSSLHSVSSHAASNEPIHCATSTRLHSSTRLGYSSVLLLVATSSSNDNPPADSDDSSA